MGLVLRAGGSSGVSTELKFRLPEEKSPSWEEIEKPRCCEFQVFDPCLWTVLQVSADGALFILQTGEMLSRYEG